MKLLSCFPLHQHLFAAALVAGASLILSVVARAQDLVIFKDGTSQSVKVLGTTATSISVQAPQGMTAFPLGTVTQVNMAPPADFTKGMDAYAAKNFPSAAVALGSVAQKFRGLPVAWAQQAMASLGDAYLAMNDLAKAGEAYAALQKAYPGKADAAVTVGQARIAFAKKDYAGAKQKLQPLAAKALQTRSVPIELGNAYSQTFYVLGQIEEQAGNFPAALENYLRTVTLFYSDKIAMADAQEHADALRKAHSVAVP